MAEREIRRVSTMVTVLSLVVLTILGIADLLLEEQVPIVLYGVIGGIALGADKDTIPTIFGGKK